MHVILVVMSRAISLCIFTRQHTTPSSHPTKLQPKSLQISPEKKYKTPENAMHKTKGLSVSSVKERGQRKRQEKWKKTWMLSETREHLVKRASPSRTRFFLRLRYSLCRTGRCMPWAEHCNRTLSRPLASVVCRRAVLRIQWPARTIIDGPSLRGINSRIFPGCVFRSHHHLRRGV